MMNTCEIEFKPGELFIVNVDRIFPENRVGWELVTVQEKSTDLTYVKSKIMFHSFKAQDEFVLSREDIESENFKVAEKF